jgi:hypothetical protein
LNRNFFNLINNISLIFDIILWFELFFKIDEKSIFWQKIFELLINILLRRSWLLGHDIINFSFSSDWDDNKIVNHFYEEYNDSQT